MRQRKKRVVIAAPCYKFLNKILLDCHLALFAMATINWYYDESRDRFVAEKNQLL
jgi:septin family protein